MRAPRARDFTHFLHFVTGFLRSARKNTCFFRKNGYNLGDTNKCSILKKEREKAPSHVDAKRQRGKGAFGHPRLTKTNICRGAGLPSRPGVKILFPLLHQILHPLFLCERRRKEKANKKKRQKETRQRKLFEKSFLWNPSKTFGHCRRVAT